MRISLEAVATITVTKAKDLPPMSLTKTATLETLAKPAMCGACGGDTPLMPAGTEIYRIRTTTTEGIDFSFCVKSDHMILHRLDNLI